MLTINEMKQYFWYLFGIMGIVFFWAGIWDGLGNISYLENPLISLLVGLFLLTLSGVIFKDANPLWGKGDNSLFHKLNSNSKKNEFSLIYYDKLKKKKIKINTKNLHKVEKGHLVLIENGKELFIPKHRIKEILHNGKVHWKAK